MSALMSLRAGGWPAAAGARARALTLPPASAARTTFAIVADRADPLAPAYAYKGDWADAGMPVSDYAGGFTWLGSLYARLYLGSLRPRLKAALEALPRLAGEWERWRRTGKAQAASADPELPLQGG